jgi:hypothetical protein
MRLIYQAIVAGKAAFPQSSIGLAPAAGSSMSAGSRAASSMEAQASAKEARSQVCQRSKPVTPMAQQTANKAQALVCSVAGQVLISHSPASPTPSSKTAPMAPSSS